MKNSHFSLAKVPEREPTTSEIREGVTFGDDGLIAGDPVLMNLARVADVCPGLSRTHHRHDERSEGWCSFVAEFTGRIFQGTPG